MVLSRRHLTLAGLSAPFLAAAPAIAQAGWRPTQAVRLVIPFAPGTAMDPVARFVQNHIQESLGVPLVIENRPGAATVVAGTDVLRAPADGHTMFMIANSFAANVTLRAQRTATWPREFSPLVQATFVPHVLTVAKGIGDDFKGFMDYAKTPSREITYGSPGVGTSLHLGAEQFSRLAGIKSVHAAYNGTAQLILDITAGRVQFMFANLPDVVQPVREGQMRALAVAAEKRSREFPDVPTVGELGFPQVLSDSWFGIVVRSETPDPAKAVLERAWIAALTNADIRARLEALGYDVPAKPSAEFAALIQKYIQVYAGVIKDANISVD
jgi:tripartite-type tricarboxylate transporter receptor subunit TctC